MRQLQLLTFTYSTARSLTALRTPRRRSLNSPIFTQAGGLTPYGRFFNPAPKDADAKPLAPPASVPSQTGMFVIYAPAFAVGTWFALSAAGVVPGASSMGAAAAVNGRELVCAAMVALHFFKRLVEVCVLGLYVV